MQPYCLVLNCGSSSIKFAVYDLELSPLPATPHWSGKIDDIHSASPRWSDTRNSVPAIVLRPEQPHADAVALIQHHAHAVLGHKPAAVMHRLVHGGGEPSEPMTLNVETLAELRRAIPLAAIHQPYALDAIDHMLSDWPDVAQWACFDSTFHQSAPQHARMLPLPRSVWDRGIQRHGFHGLSYEYLAHTLRQRYGDAGQGRVIGVHLGSQASLCAMLEGESRYTTMGYSALDGLMGGSSSGTLDPGVILHLMQTDGMSADEVIDLLSERSGLLGVSGLSADPQVLLENEVQHAEARDALTLYVHQVARGIAALIPELGGLDLLVFSGGVGENSAEIRRRICDRLACFGVLLDLANNVVHAPCISQPGSAITVLVEPTNEEWMMARHAQALR